MALAPCPSLGLLRVVLLLPEPAAAAAETPDDCGGTHTGRPSRVSSPQSPEPACCESVLSASPALSHRPSPSECGEAREEGSRVESGHPGPTGRNEEAEVREAGVNLLPCITAVLPACTVTLIWSYQCAFSNARPPGTRENHRGVLGQGP